VLEHVEAVEALIATELYDVVAVSGDVGQRARAGEFQRAAVFLRDAARVSRTITVAGNHDVAWWLAPLGVGSRDGVTAKYRRYVSPTLEPVLRVPGATFVGLNTAHGVAWRTLTCNPRDIGVIGALAPAQLVHVAEEFARAPAGDAWVVVMHHSPLRGELSHRYGVRRGPAIVAAFADMGVDLVLCGHDHQEAIERVTVNGRATIVAVAGTLSSRSRGGRPASVHAITIGPSSLEIVTRVWAPETRTFEPARAVTFPR
jgi:3',5'-cyclic AMP phosphodiesterase CpdA